MTKPKLIFQGAEAKIFLVTPSSKTKTQTSRIVLKDRVKKTYRIPELDTKIRKRRTKAETKLLTKAAKIINSPKPTESKDINKINMSYIDGKKLSDHLDKFPLAKQKQILKQIGQDVAKLHDNQIIHGDLTTSNMILAPAPTKNQFNEKNSPINKISAKKSDEVDFVANHSRAKGECIFFIDFGLGFISLKSEDKAVDIHLLKQALEAKHFKHWEVLFKEFVKGYKKSKDAEKTLTQLSKVEKRRRYKH